MEGIEEQTELQQYFGQLPGSKSEDFYDHYPIQIPVKDFPTVQSYIEYNNYKIISTAPDGINEEILHKILDHPEEIPKFQWIYEYMRVFVIEIAQFAGELESVCTSSTCKLMNAGNFVYQCASHQKPQSCCAIDYISHTIETVWQLLNNKKQFQDRRNITEQNFLALQGMARRLYRVFSHVYFQHTDEFSAYEECTYLHLRFKTFADQYQLVTPENFIEKLNQSIQSQSKKK
ncbi:MAG: putative preimplantation protein 3 [Streblomastix strix]|uniref:Putative preimplantation protein 3 n=1 Tax=Streblomastix strix TaxID=222440 RepID=A0A5J4UV79_9EUKA|nr:MAG: putative preimplantation protein 3 [Streblomastix strix]